MKSCLGTQSSGENKPPGKSLHGQHHTVAPALICLARQARLAPPDAPCFCSEAKQKTSHFRLSAAIVSRAPRYGLRGSHAAPATICKNVLRLWYGAQANTLVAVAPQHPAATMELHVSPFSPGKEGLSMRRRRLSLIVLATFALALVLLHLLLPLLIRDYLNRQFADMGGYRGHVEDVDLALWRGAYRINGLTVARIDEEVPVPFIDAPQILLAVSWRALWRGAVVARVQFLSPSLNFVDGGDEAGGQAGEGVNWRARLEQMVPVRIDELSVRDGEVHFRNFHSKPPVDVYLTQLNMDILNLRNTRSADGTRVATLEATGLLQAQAPTEAEVRLDPFGELDDFDLQLRITDLSLTALNELAGAYGKFDFAAGEGDFVMELSAENGRLSGYAKPLFRDVRVFAWEQDVESDDKPLLRAGWEALVDLLATVFRNQPERQFATRVPIEGSLEQTDIPVLRTIGGVLRNAFIEAYQPWFEEQTGTDR